MVLNTQEVHVKQFRELIELFGFETRNKYQILTPDGSLLGYAAEQNKGLLGWLGRQFFGHWRPFEIIIFDSERQPILRCRHPFRFFFQKLEIETIQGRHIGELVQRFSVFSKKFDINLLEENRILQMRSPFWKFWTFPISFRNQTLAVIQKKWSGLLKETFLDADNFRVQFLDPDLSLDTKLVIMASSIFVDLQYFEKKAD